MDIQTESVVVSVYAFLKRREYDKEIVRVFSPFRYDNMTAARSGTRKVRLLPWGDLHRFNSYEGRGVGVIL